MKKTNKAESMQSQIDEALHNIDEFYKKTSTEAKENSEKILLQLASVHETRFLSTKTLLIGIIAGITGGVLGAYIVHITLNGLNTLTWSSIITIISTLIVTIEILHHLSKENKKQKSVYNLFSDPKKRHVIKKFLTVYEQFKKR